LALALAVFPFRTASAAEETGEAYGTGRNAVLDLYQDFVSPARGSRCGMHPSCSQYAKLAFASLNPVDAYLATMDRLMRCTQDAGTYPARYVGGQRLSYDPVSAPPALEEAIVPPASPAAASAPAGEAALPGWLEGLDFPSDAFAVYARAYASAADPQGREAALRGMSRCLRHRGDYRGLGRLHRFVLAHEPGLASLGKDLYAEEAAALFDAGEYERSLSVLRLRASRPEDPDFARVQLLRCLDLARLQRMHDLTAATAPLSGPDYGKAAEGLRALPAAVDALPRKKPALAGMLSAVIPGAGYAYAGRPGAGFASFLINGLFFWTVSEAVLHRNYAIAATAGALGAGWYAGGIRGAYHSAQQENYRARQQAADGPVQTGYDAFERNEPTRSEL